MVVSVLAFYSDDTSSSPAEIYLQLLFCELFEKDENKQKEAGNGLFKNK